MEDDTDAWSRFDMFLFKIAGELEASHVKDAAFLLKSRLGGRHGVIKDANDLLEELSRVGWVTPSDVSNMRELLNELPRRDLLYIVDEYEEAEILIPSRESGGLRPNAPDMFFGREQELERILEHLTRTEPTGAEADCSHTSHTPNDSSRDQLGLLANSAQHKFGLAERRGHISRALISGFPGMGKTHLARRAVTQLSEHTDRFHREILVDLRELTAVESVYFALMSSLGKPMKEYDATHAQLVRVLANRKQDCVLVLDNADKMLEPGSPQEPNILKEPFLELLENITTIHNPHVKLIITSRYQVGDSQTKFHVSTEVLDKMALEDAVKLIEYHMDSANIKYEDAEILGRKCGFHPLAMKIVAGRLKTGVVPLKTVIKELDEKPMLTLNLLELMGLPGAGLVEQGLHSTFSDLPHILKKTLICLSVIPGTFDVAAVRDILETSGSLEVKLRLQSLMSRNLIEADRAARRFKIHLLLKSYLQRIADSDQEFRKCRKQSDKMFVKHYNKKLCHLGSLLSTDHNKALQKKDVELPNLLATLQRHAATQETPDQQQYLEIIQLMELIQEESERYEYFKEMAERTECNGDIVQCIFHKSLQLKQMADLRYPPPELKKLSSEIEELLMKYPNKSESWKVQVAYALYCMYAGEAKVRQGSQTPELVHNGITLLQKSVEAFKESLSPVSTWCARANNALGFAYHSASLCEESKHRQHIAHALKCFENALQIRQNINERHFDTSTYFLNIGACYESLGDKKKALGHYQKALSMDKEINMSNYSTKGSILWNICTVYYKLKEYTKALNNVRKFIRIKQREYDEHPFIAKGYTFAGIILLNKKPRDTQLARKYLDTALQLEERLMVRGRGPSDLWRDLQKAIKSLCHLTDNDVAIPAYQTRFQKAEESKTAALARLEAGLPLNLDESDSDEDSEHGYPRRRKRGRFERAGLPVYEPDGSDEESSSDESVDLGQIRQDVQRAQILGTGRRFSFLKECVVM